MKTTQFKSEKNKLTITRIFDAPIELVWRAWTEAELLDQWWAPKPWQSQTKSMDFKVGGSRLYAMVGPAGEEHWGITNYNGIVRHITFSGEDVFCDNEGTVNPDLPVANFVNHFHAKADKTSLIIETEYSSEEQLKQIIEMGMKEGLSMAFENLDHTLDSLVRKN